MHAEKAEAGVAAVFTPGDRGGGYGGWETPAGPWAPHNRPGAPLGAGLLATRTPIPSVSALEEGGLSLLSRYRY